MKFNDIVQYKKMSLIGYVVFIFIFLPIDYCFAFNSLSLQGKIDTLIESELPNAHVSVLVKDTSGNILYKRDSNKFMYPASSTKLFTASAALFKLGPEFRFSTKLSRLGDNYYITFSGDPSFTSDKLKKLISKIKKSNPKIRNIILDTSAFLPPYYGGGTSYDDLGHYYAAPSTALILNQNLAEYDFITSKNIGGPVKIVLKSANSPIVIKNKLITSSVEDAKNYCDMNVQILEKNHLILYGCMSQKEEPEEVKLAITDPVSYSKRIILNALSQNRISFSGKITEGKTPSNAKLISIDYSDKLPILIAHMLIESDNLYADSITKTLGKKELTNGTYKEGAFAIKKILTENSSVNIDKIKLADGFGSRYCMSTADEFVTLLSDIYKNDVLYPIILESLPRMGVSGTLKKRLTDSELKDRIFAKTGSFQDSSSLSGYLFKSDSKVLIFSIISNQVYNDIKKAKSLEEKILETIYNHNL